MFVAAVFRLLMLGSISFRLQGITCLGIHRSIRIIYRSFQSSPEAYAELIQIYGQDRALRTGRVLHAHLIVSGLTHLTLLATKLISFYSECGKICYAHKVFDKIPVRNIRGWIALIGVYARLGYYKEVLSVFSDMQRKGLRPNIFVLPSILKACGHLFSRQTGEKIHCIVLKCSFEHDAFINSSLIDMYSKCGRVEEARRVFDEMAEKNVVALNAMVSGYSQHGFAPEAFSLVERMDLLGLKPNVVTWNSLIAGFSQKGDEVTVSKLLKLMRVNGVEPDVVSWNSIISGFVQNFDNVKAFDTFTQMLSHGMYPSSATISCLLSGCANVADMKHGMEIHGYAIVAGVESDIFVRSALVDMYAKCGFISEARTLFHMMPEKNTVTWNSMIFGYANHGYCKEAIELFNQLKDSDQEKLNHLTFTAVLTACSHAGMIELGQDLFSLMQEKYRIKPRLEHYTCMVDLLGRAGKIDEAYDMIKTMPMEPDLFVWGALLGASKTHGNVDVAEEAAKHLSKLEEGSAGSGLLSNLYAEAGNWENAARLKNMMKKRRLTKLPGCSWIEVA